MPGVPILLPPELIEWCCTGVLGIRAVLHPAVVVADESGSASSDLLKDHWRPHGDGVAGTAIESYPTCPMTSAALVRSISAYTSVIAADVWPRITRATSIPNCSRRKVAALWRS